MNFFFDANISYRISNMIAAMCEDSHNIMHIYHHEDFKCNNIISVNGKIAGNSTKDLEWITKLGRSEKDWKVISGDCDILDTAHERAALLESRMTFFACDPAWEKLKAPEQSWKMVKIWGEIVRHSTGSSASLFRIRTARNPSIETISSGGRARGGQFRS